MKQSSLQLCWIEQEPFTIDVTVTSFNVDHTQLAAFAPTRNIWCEFKLPWITLDQSLVCEDTETLYDPAQQSAGAVQCVSTE